MRREAQHIDVHRLPRESLLGGTWKRVAVRGDHSLTTFNWMDPAMPPQPVHSHDFDQVSLVTSGVMEFTVDGRTYLVEAGHALVIPGGAPHTAVAVGDGPALNIDVYAPPRPDYLYLTAYQGPGFPAAALGDADRHAVAALLAEWAHRIDHGDPRTVADLLTDDAVVTGLGPDRHGPDGMREWAAARPSGRRTRHHLSDLHHGSRPDGTVTGTARVVLQVVTDDDPLPRVEFAGTYTDTIVRTHRGLLFSRRDLLPLPWTTGA